MDEKATKPGEPTCANRDSEHAASGREEFSERTLASALIESTRTEAAAAWLSVGDEP
jgi:hypothetical protein